MLKKLVLTGARGNLGTVLRDPLSRMCKTLVTTDIRKAPDDLLPNEHYVQADLSRMEEIAPLLKGADMVIHFGAIVDEKPFEDLLGPNFVGAYNVWEAAHRHGVKRVVYASSIHAVGMYPTNAGIDTEVAHRPDTFYGLAKCFAEDLGRMYWEKRGLESVHLRILSCTPEPQNTRALGTWLSYGDLVRLVTRAIDTPTVGFSVIYGVSANTRAPVSNHRVPFLGYRPEDNAETHAPALFAKAPPADPQDLALTRVGGPFAAIPLGESGLAAIKAMTEAGSAPAQGRKGKSGRSTNDAKDTGTSRKKGKSATKDTD
jgi:uronate dehydrogenase